ncbi:MAG: hypothetical protein J5854_06960 [Clostridia bacterium]|nr:hypothetical protein [Clostridia bacterium]
MNARDKLFELILPVFESVFGRFEREDLLFFGDRADVVSPAPKKNSLDAEPNMVYNIKSSSYKGALLFEDVTASGGFVNMTLSNEAIGLLADVFVEGRLLPGIPDGFRIGGNGELLAMLIPIAKSCGGEFPPKDPAVRRATLSAMFSDTPESLNRAAAHIRRALKLDRAARVSGKRLIPGRAALIMALALESDNK